MLSNKIVPFVICVAALAVISSKTLKAQENCAKEEEKHVVIEYDQKRLEVTQTCWHPQGVPAYPGNMLKVQIQNAGKKKAWQFEGSSLNPEGWSATTAPVVIQDFKNRSLLLLQQYSGGAGCCWSMLAFDIEHLEFLSNSPSSQTTIDYDHRTDFDDSNCNIGVWATPINPSEERALAKRGLYCFNGKKFVPQKSK